MFLDAETDPSTSPHSPLQAPGDVKIIGWKWVFKKKINAPGDVKIIGWKWVFKKKINADGSTCYKVRLVIKGFEHVAGTDLGETYAPLSKLTTFQLLMSPAARHNWRVNYMDVVTAFLNPKIDCEVVYISLQPGIS